jgi:1-acyl-sn-glycerol-3-phosphate acyltransferase
LAENHRFPLGLSLRILASVALARPRSAATDAERLLASFRPEPRVEGDHHIPAAGRFILVANHYERRGLSLAWGVLTATRAISRRCPGAEVHWVATAEWQGHPLWGLPVPDLFWRWLFARGATSYRFFLIPPQARKVLERARAIRRARELALRGGIIGVTPEGESGEGLREARPGSGSFLMLLSRGEIPLLPAGISEPEGILTVAFGPPFVLAEPPVPHRQWDAWARARVMLAIARLLPPGLRGHYRPLAEREAP